MTNAWCTALGITPPRLEAVVGHREAGTFALFLVALLERDAPMTLPEVAARFASAGVHDEARALQALKRCRPARPPVYRDGEHYHLDPHDDDLDLWAFRLGLRPPRVNLPPEPPREVTPLPGPEVPLTAGELDEGWREQGLTAWSQQRLAIAVLDVLGRPGTPEEVVAEVAGRTRWHGLNVAAPGFRRPGSGVEVLADGRWALRSDATEAVRSARLAVRERVAMVRKHNWKAPPSAALLEADAKSLHALYEYGRLHGVVRLRRGRLDERIAVPWVHHDDPRLHHLEERALALGVPLEIVVGTAPDWAAPWSRTELAFACKAPAGWPRWLEDEHGHEFEEAYIQRARLAVAVH